MFTGIIVDLGKIEKIEKKDALIKLGISSKRLAKDTIISDSIAVNGACLTVTAKDADTLFFEAIGPTLKLSNLKRLAKGDLVNLEPALKIGDKLGGHFVLGHVDGEVKLRRKVEYPDHKHLEILSLAENRKFIIKNGSITLNGVSLSIKDVLSQYFTVDIIPYTWQNTNLRFLKPGDWLNIEYDYLLKGQRIDI